MATITVGKLTEFDPKSDSITAYVERVALYFQANEVAEGKQVAVFLSAIGPQTYALLRSLVTPAIPKHKTFAELIEILKEHYEPKPSLLLNVLTFTDDHN